MYSLAKTAKPKPPTKPAIERPGWWVKYRHTPDSTSPLTGGKDDCFVNTTPVQYQPVASLEEAMLWISLLHLVQNVEFAVVQLNDTWYHVEGGGEARTTFASPNATHYVPTRDTYPVS